MKKGKKIVYWDADIFITIIEGDKSDLDLFNGAIYSKDQIEKKECFLVVSENIRLEVHETIIPQNAKKIFEDVLKRSNVQTVAVGRRITALANELQDECAKIGRVLKGMDATHLATAVIYEVDEFYTNDDKLLKLNGKINIPFFPKIVRPPLPIQPSLPLVMPPE
jgi:predicted nucleic acid-binding protein